MFGARATARTIKTSQVNVEWTLLISEIRVFFAVFKNCQALKKIQMVTQIKCRIKAKRHGRSVLRNQLTTRSAVGAIPSVSAFLPPP